MKIALLLVLSAGMCVGQNGAGVCCATGNLSPLFQTDGLETARMACAAMEPENRNKTEACRYVASHPAQPAPLKCGKYEHVDDTLRKLCLALEPETRNKLPHCNPLPKDVVCVPDVHVVTEKEWQELMDRLDALRRWNSSLAQRVNELIDEKRK